MSTRSSARKLFPPLDNPKLIIRRRSRTDPTLLNNSEMAAEGNGDLPVPDLRTIEELCQPSLNGRSIKVNGVTDDALRLYLFPHSLTHHVIAWFDRLPRNSFNTFEQMAKMFLGKYFPPSMVTKLRNKITNFRQYTFYNGLTLRHRDTINAAAGGTFMKRPLKAKMAEINKNLMRVLQVNQQVKAVTPNCETYGGPHSFSDYPATIGNTQNVYAAGAYQGPPGFNQNQNRNNQNMNFHNQNRNQENHNPQGNNQGRNQFFQGANKGQNQPPAYQAPAYQAPVDQAPIHQSQIPQPQVVTTNEFTNFMKANNAILKNMQTNMTSLTNLNLELKNMFGQFMKMNTASSSGSGTLPGNTITNPKEDLKGITTRSGTAYQGPMIPTTSSSVVERETEATKDTMHSTNNGSIKDDLNFNISFVDDLILMLKFGPSIKSLLTNKDKLCELARTPLNEHCSAVLLKQLPEKLGDPDKFLIPCDFPGMAEFLALADLGASINLMPLSLWNKLSLLDMSPMCMTLELDDRLISHLVGVAENIFVKVGTFHFLADFVVVDFDADPRVPLILGRSFLKTERAFIDVFEGELTLRVGKEAITFNLDQTSRYSANYSDMTANRINVIDMAFEEYSQEVLGFSEVITSGNPTPYYDSIVSTTSLTLTPFRNNDFLLEEIDAFLALEDDPTSPEVDQYYVDTERDILLLESFLNDDPSLPPPNQGNYLPEVRKELKIYEANSDKSSIDKPLEVELKDLPPHLEYVFLEGEDKFPVIIAKDLSVEEKTALITVLKSHKRAIAWKISDIKECVEGFQTLKRKLTEAPILIAPDWDMPFELMCDASDFAIGAVLRQRQEKYFRPIHYAIYKGHAEVRCHLPFSYPVSPSNKWSGRAYKTPIGCTLYKLVYGKACHLSIELEHKAYWALKHANFNLQTVGDHRKVQLNELRDQAYENSLIYKEKTKRLHDSKTKDRVFNIGDRVLLFNSRLKIFSGKLKSRWSGPFTISHVFPYGTVELSQPDGPNFKVNDHRLKHYFGEYIPKLVVPDLQTFPKDQ
uniref:Reverse transcriptase domain-containing protein n=1 Tax=Tanacetum cinerariifolium TaxID=118510 RepID=A0A6L2NQN3_TANCI|nr:reverse transcriptase domain-containing protein [Tanacetum cinerariifolium]